MSLRVERFVLVIEDAFDRRDEVEQGRVDAVAVAEELFECGAVRFKHGEGFGPRDGRAAADHHVDDVVDGLAFEVLHFGSVIAGVLGEAVVE